jgi:hypothetical protein
MAAGRVEPADVQTHLDRILVSAAFRQSPRCCRFLSFVVENGLKEDHERLRERSIGIELFNRPAHYDANNDPIVRVTASDARRRLAQYYRDSGAADRLRLELPTGSYFPEWRTVETEKPLEANPPARPSRSRFWIVPALIAMGLVLLSIAGWRYSHRADAALDRFWAPLLASDGPVLISMGTPSIVGLDPVKVKEFLRYWDAIHEVPPRAGLDSARPLIGFGDLKPLLQRYVPLGDSIALSRLSVFLDRRNRAFRVRPSGLTSQTDFSDGTVILVGAYTNEWLLRTTESMRYRFVENNGAVEAIVDSKSGRLWYGEPLGRGDIEDYALICRAKDRSSDRFVLSVAGLRHPGTNAASECVVSPTCMAEAAAMAGPLWNSHNLQIFISTHTAHTEPGRPSVIAVHAW